jgi:hypothetical protein
MSVNKTKYENEEGEREREHPTVKHTFYSLQQNLTLRLFVT